MAGSWGYRDARRLRASAPHAKPFVPSLTRRKRKALIAGLFRCAIQEVRLGWGRSHQGAEGDRCGCNCQLVHDDPSPLVVSQPYWLHKFTVNIVVNFYYLATRNL
jgi:hypothetical protein